MAAITMKLRRTIHEKVNWEKGERKCLSLEVMG